jgi:hypothetical protein
MTAFATDDPAWPRRLLLGCRPTKGWQADPATEPQLAALARRGYDPPDTLTKGQAAFVLNQPSPRQLAALRARGLYEDWNPELSFSEAAGLLDTIARHEGWAAR